MIAVTPVPEAVLVPAFSVVTVEPNVPNVKAWSPETFTVVAEVAVKPVKVLAELVETKFTVSIPVKVNVPPDTALNVTVAESAVPATAAVVKPKFASCPVLVTRSAVVTALPMLVKVAAAVLAEDSTVVTPVVPNKPTVPAALKFALTVSIPTIEAAA
jgi:hypothetical protein